LIRQELLFSVGVTFVLSFISESTFSTTGFGNEKTSCLLGLMTMPYAVNLLRASLFIGYMAMVAKQATFYFPYPFMWIFRDFGKFIFEPYCIRVFECYLANREPQSKRE
jgi:hypothetical protein